jgi:hypothetical protein
MKKLAALALSLFLVSGTALADTPKDADAQPAKPAQPAQPKAAKSAEKTDAAFAAELEELRQALQAQQEQLQMLKEELAKRDHQIDEARAAAAAANSRAAEASSKATEAVNSTAEVKSTTASLSTTVSGLTASNEALKTSVATAQVEVSKATEEGPASIRYKGITITPGGFIEAATVFRTRAVSADINTPFNSIPYPGNSLSRLSENNFTGRQSRISLLAEGKIGIAKLSGYYETDWLGTGVTSNNRQSNSYVNRQRQIWGQLALDNGFSVTAGQMWSLATENRKGIQNRGEWIPLTIDPQYNVGYTWERQYGFRLVQDFSGKFALGFSIEGPEATLGGRGFNAFTSTSATGTVTTSQNFFINAPGAGGGLYNFVDGLPVFGSGTGGYTTNKAPDFIFKAAADPGYGHYELFGIVSIFRNRIFPCGVVGTTAKNLPTPATPTVVACSVNGTTAPSAVGAFNDTHTGGGIGGSARFPLLAKKLEFGIKAVGGDGVGRYGSAQLADVTVRPNDTLALIRTVHGLASLEYHPTPKLDLYAYFGDEYVWRAGYKGYTSITVTNTPAIPATATTPLIPATSATTIKLNQIGGYGSPFANNSGCSLEGTPTTSLTPSATGGTCAGDTRHIYEATIGFWHKLYQGPKGGLRWSIQYSYFSRNGWSGNNSSGGTSTAAGVSPKAVNNMVWTSFRYYIP